MSKEDPKHGRWILPLVVAGLIWFTWLFVNNQEAATVPGATTTTEAAASSTTSSTSSTTTTTTTLAPDVQALVNAIEELRTQASDLAAEAEAVNTAWDEGEAAFAATRDSLDSIRARAATLATAASGVELPESFTGTWDEIAASADDMATAGDGMYQGFIGGSSSAPRKEALTEFLASAEAMVDALDDAVAAVSA